MSKYISRYAKHDTHFHRTDPFKLASFDEDVDTAFSIAMASFIFMIAVAAFTFLMFLAAV